MKKAAQHGSTKERSRKGRFVAKRLTNERTNPYLVEIPVAAVGLDIALNRQIIQFHKSRHIQLRHGYSILKDGETYYVWCFRDSTTARAFVEQFGGALYTHSR